MYGTRLCSLISSASSFYDVGGSGEKRNNNRQKTAVFHYKQHTLKLLTDYK